VKMEISKQDKKALRQIIEIGLQREYANSIENTEKIIKKWNKDSLDHKETYMQLYHQVVNFDKKIGKRYNNMSGSNYHFIVAAQLADHLISEKELENLSENVKQAILLILNL
jgi:hypothetical protein